MFSIKVWPIEIRKGGLLFADVASILSGIFFVDVIIKRRNKKYSSNLTLESCDQFYPLAALFKIDDQSL